MREIRTELRDGKGDPNTDIAETIFRSSYPPRVSLRKERKCDER